MNYLRRDEESDQILQANFKNRNFSINRSLQIYAGSRVSGHLIWEEALLDNMPIDVSHPISPCLIVARYSCRVRMIPTLA